MLKNEMFMVLLSDIHADNEFNCREKVTQISIVELAKHIEEEGQISPVVLRRYDKPVDGKNWMLIAGYRRTKAVNLLNSDYPKKGYHEIKAVEFVGSDLEAYKLNFAENIQREELTIKEEAHAVARLLIRGMTPEGVVKEMGKSRFWVQVRQNLAELPFEIQDDVVTYNFSQNMIMELWRLPTDQQRYDAVKLVKEKLMKGEKVTKCVKTERNPNKKVTPKKEDVFLAMEKVAEICGKFNIVTRAMAWTEATCTDNEFYSDVRRYRAWLDTVQDLLDAVSAGLDGATLKTIAGKIV